MQCALRGNLDTDLFRKAWQIVISRHASLRMSCRPRATGDPLIVVWKTVALPISELDWRADSADVASELAAFLLCDRTTGLDLAEPPAQRLTLIRTADDRHQLVWTCHHLFLDGWSSAQVLHEVIDAYGALGKAESPTYHRRDPYREYYRWLTNRDQAESMTYWRGLLAGYQPVQLMPSADVGQPASLSQGIDQDTTQRIILAAASLKITPNAILQGAWALVLAQLFGVTDVAFGVTVAGRAAPVDGIDTLIANVANLIPVRCDIPSNTPTQDWLLGLRDQQFASRQHEDSFLSDIQEWADVPGGQPLFETLLVVESFPSASGVTQAAIELQDFSSDLTTTFPITLAVVLDGDWSLRLSYDTSIVDLPVAEQLLTAYATALGALAADAASGSPRRAIVRTCGDSDEARCNTICLDRASDHSQPRTYDQREARLRSI